MTKFGGQPIDDLFLDCMKELLPCVEVEIMRNYSAEEIIVLMARRVGKEVIKVRKHIPDTVLIHKEEVVNLAKSIAREFKYTLGEAIVNSPVDNFHTITLMSRDEDFWNEGDLPPKEIRMSLTPKTLITPRPAEPPSDPRQGSW